MLVRAYRLTDKLGLFVLKAGAEVSYSVLDGANLFLRSVRGIFGGAAGIVLAVLLRVGAVLLGVLGVLWNGIRRTVLFLTALVSSVVFTAARIGIRATGRTARKARASAYGTAADAMARRAARAELEAILVEDPLRAQNRLLSYIVVFVLLILVGVVLVTTDSGRPDSASPALGANLNLAQGDTTAQPTAQGVLLSTPVPTATQLPEILQVRGSLAFVARENGQNDIWVVNVGGRDPIRITNHPEDDRDPAWSPDGTRLAFASRRDGNWDIYIYQLLTQEITRMTLDLSFQARPTWSPDGSYLAYESYQANNLDIYIMRVEGISSEPPIPLPSSTNSAEFSPAWSPSGREIAYVSWQEGNQDIYVFSLDTLEARNITNTPTRHEDYPAWSPDGTRLAFSAVDEGIEKVFIKPVAAAEAPAEVFRRGRQPAWSPDGTSLVYTVDSLEGTQFVVAPYLQGGTATEITAVAMPAYSPVWTGTPLPPALVNSGGLAPAITQPLFIEQVETYPGDPPYRLGPIPNVRGPELPSLSDRVNDSFNALRERALEATGIDFLGELEHALWDLNHRPQPGEERRNWHLTGRAFSFNRNLIFGFPAEVEVVREDSDLVTYWRVFVRVSEDAQFGQLGEPLRRMPWAFVTTAQGDVEAYDQGGRLQNQIPSGYYVDFTQLAADYGWERMPAGSDWRANVFSRNFWMFRKTDGLTWYEAMRELYAESQLGGWVPTPTPVATASSEDD